MSVDAAVALLRTARRAVALTGAGVSTASGLPDFRSPGGLWEGIDPMAIASRSALARAPEAFYTFYRQRLDRLSRAAPNPAHYALAELQGTGLQAIITQNVDGLHQAAGSRVVIEVHGNLREAACTGCGRLGSIELIRVALAEERLPRCAECGGLLKPNVVLFEDLLPPDAWEQAVDAARAADVMLVAGSSLQVVPAAYLPQETLDAGGRLIIVNREPTSFDTRAAVVIAAEVEQVLPAIASALGAPLVGSRPEAD